MFSIDLEHKILASMQCFQDKGESLPMLSLMFTLFETLIFFKKITAVGITLKDTEKIYF